MGAIDREAKPPRRWLPWVVGIGVVVLAAFLAPWGRGSPTVVAGWSAAIAAAGACLFALKAICRRCDPVPLALLSALAVGAVIVYTGFFGFHGEGSFVHHHDVAHYYLGSKYFRELGYPDLYVAMLRAEAELHDDRFWSLGARDLGTNEIVPIDALLARSDSVKDRFHPERWRAFRSDVEIFRRAMGPGYATVLRDFGFNATPVWAFLGGWVANLVPPGSSRGILLLTLLDPLLLAVAFGALAATFGGRTALAAVLCFCTVFGASFFWTGGAFLRHPWLVASVLGACALGTGRRIAAGALFGLATALKLFPLLLVAPLLPGAVDDLREGRPFAGSRVGFFASFAIVLVVLVGASALRTGGFERWSQFAANTTRHLEIVSPNVVSLTQALALPDRQERVTWEELRELRRERRRTHRLVLVFGFLPLLLLVWALARRRSDLGAVVLGLPLLLVGLNLAAYYWSILVLVVVARRRRPRDLAALFAVEAGAWGFSLLQGREAARYAMHATLLALLFLVLIWRPVQEELRASPQRPVD